MTSQTTAEYYTMTFERAVEIAACDPSLTPELVRQFALADWAEGAEHQRWLDSAPAAEVADWVLAGGEEADA